MATKDICGYIASQSENILPPCTFKPTWMYIITWSQVTFFNADYDYYNAIYTENGEHYYFETDSDDPVRH
jgi:hypothetical protein